VAAAERSAAATGGFVSNRIVRGFPFQIVEIRDSRNNFRDLDFWNLESQVVSYGC
jgi:hypothetical protein